MTGVMVGLGFAALMVSSSRSGGALVAVTSALAVAASALLGVVLGVAEQAGPQERVAYEGPITRYVAGEDRR